MGYLERLDSYREDMIRTLGESVAFPSVNAEPVRTADGEVLPYGRGVHDSLIHMLKTGAAMGFDVCNVDNHAGYIEFKVPDDKAEGARQLGIVGHLDVMPEGTGWTGDPFVMTEEDGFLYGRGVSDDKGPVIASLYAMKAIKEEGIIPSANIRLILGLNEETGDSSIVHYTEKCGHPDMGFTPDGDFPIVNGEMGILVFELAQKLTPVRSKDDLRLTKFESGTAHNAVPATARAVVMGTARHYDMIIERAKLFCAETGHKVRAYRQGSSLVITADGIAAHGAHPHLGLNAISVMMQFLGDISFACDDLNDFIAFYNDHIGFDINGDRCGCDFKDDPSGSLIFNVGIANINEELATLSINIRYPVTFTDDDVIRGMESCLAGTPIGIVKRMAQGPIFMDTDTDMVRKMIRAYVDETGDTETPPIVQPGGTYAKMVNNILCFGAQFPGDENTMHQADEKLSVESFMKMARVYARAIYSLCCE